MTASSIIRSALLLLLLALLCSTASPSPVTKGGGLAPRQTGDFAAAAVPAAADSAPITDHRSPITTAAAAAGPAAPPLLPQPVPALSIQIILQLARGSACRDAAKAIEEDNIAGALAMLDALVSGPFHWRGGVTNGYQQGFFVYALRGYCLERIGDIVKAYRNYQNSRACFDDQAAAMQCPEPRLEVFLGIGRTCNVAGRYTDAFNWLDLVRLEASATPRLAAAADRALIRRAVEIGDYHDAITNYGDLQAQLASGEFSRREQILATNEYVELAQLYFWTYQDRPGFAKLLEGLTKIGIDNDLGIKDALVVCFLNNIARADDAEVRRFYDLLGYALLDARSLNGDEEYIAFLCNARTLMCTVYDFLPQEEDLKKVHARIEQVQAQLAKLPATAISVQPGKQSGGKPGTVAPTLNAYGQVSASPAIVIEDLLMLGDCLAHRGERGKAGTVFGNAYAAMTNTPLASQAYDGTTAGNAAQIGMLVASRNWRSAAAGNVVPDGSHRYMSYEIEAFDPSNSAACIALIQTVRISGLPHAAPVALAALQRTINTLVALKCSDEAIEAANEYVRRVAFSTMVYHQTAILMLARNDSTAAFRWWMNEEFGPQQHMDHYHNRGWCRFGFELASRDDLLKYAKAWKSAEIHPALLELAASYFVKRANTEYAFERALQFAADIVPNELHMRDALDSGDYSTALRLSDAPSIYQAQAFLGMGNTNATIDCLWALQKEKERIVGFPVYPSTEIDAINKIIAHAHPSYIQRYLSWLQRISSAHSTAGKTQDVTNIEQRIAELTALKQTKH
ncbi:MAG: hypothetical protein NTV22_19100 [bacterium]|nr:hypothetical protein [bacterium]